MRKVVLSHAAFALVVGTRGLAPSGAKPVANWSSGTTTKKETAQKRAHATLRPMAALVDGYNVLTKIQVEAMAPDVMRQLVPSLSGSRPLLRGMKPPPQPPRVPAIRGPIIGTRSAEGTARAPLRAPAARLEQFIKTWQRWISYEQLTNSRPMALLLKMPLSTLGRRYTTVQTERHTATRASLHTNGTGAPHIIAAIVLPPKLASTISAQPWKKFMLGVCFRIARALAMQKPTSVR
mmetsp:Transcript_50554/g.116676  ORF Transcript_50554/g.116676 Transcript_50554/m.116676 type:complete len:236 (+) Transcript_50554:220-927(+)